MGEEYVSRTRQYVERRSAERTGEDRLASLESQLEDHEIRNLRLSKELLDETTLRARAERSRDDLKEELRTLTVKMAEMELQGSTKQPKKKPKPVEEAPTPVETPKPRKRNTSSRTRGNVK